MVRMDGKYEHVKNENFVEYLTTYGVPEDHAKLIDSMRPNLEVQVDGKKISFISDSGVQNASSTFVLDEEIDEPTPMGVTLKSVTKLNGNILTVESVTPDKQKAGTRTYEFSESELVMILSGDSDRIPKARRFYKRL